MKLFLATLLVLSTTAIAADGAFILDPYQRRIASEKRYQAALEKARAEGFAAGQKEACKPTRLKKK